MVFFLIGPQVHAISIDTSHSGESLAKDCQNYIGANIASENEFSSMAEQDFAIYMHAMGRCSGLIRGVRDAIDIYNPDSCINIASDIL